MNTERHPRTGPAKARKGFLPWVLPPMAALALVLGWTAIREGGLGPEVIVASALFVLLAIAVGVFGRRYEAKRAAAESKTGH